jgi:uncharacterized protein
MLSAAKLGDPSAMLDVGYLYDLGIGVRADRDLAMYWYKRAFRRGYGSGANNIGTIYRTEMKPQRAIQWFRKAVSLGEIDSNLDIAKLYLDQLGDTLRAIPHLRKVVAAKPRIEVTKASWEEANFLLKELARKESK